MMKKLEPKGIMVFIEGKKKRVYAGFLSKSKDQYYFQYDPEYLKKPFAISLGPELPLRKKKYTLDKRGLIPFHERIPQKRNPAYPVYCKSVGISTEEDDLFTLLATLGHRGPSSFVFEGWYPDEFGLKEVTEFRKFLELSPKEFNEVFNIPFTLKKGEPESKECFKRIEIYANYPEVALDQLRKGRAFLARQKYRQAYKKLLESENEAPQES